MNFDAIFAEYYTLFRGQATSIPVFGDPEYAIAIQLGNNSIRKWARTDGEEWKELWTTLRTVYPSAVGAASMTIAGMRKTPKGIWFANGSHFDVIEPSEVDDYTSLNGLAYFTGGANTGWKLNLGGNISGVLGNAMDFPLLKTPSFIPTTGTPGSFVPEMSDPNFMIQDMLASRASNERNGFVYKIAKQDALVALQNMKVENHSGTQGDSINLFGNKPQTGWGVSGNASSII